MTAKIPCDYRTHKHIPSRSCYQLIFEVSEELFPVVCDTLGFPKAGVNTYVNIELSTPDNIKSITQNEKQPSKNEKSEGEKLLALSHIRCKDTDFQEFLKIDAAHRKHAKKLFARDIIYNECNITSRSELKTDVAAQKKFRELDQKFKDWQYGQRYKDNLDREC